MRREYKTGMKWAFWRWKDVLFNDKIYLRRLILLQCPLGSIMIHWFYDIDRQEHLHDHPVDFLSIVLRGGYVEEYVLRTTNYVTSSKRTRRFNWIPHTKYHRIIRLEDRPVTLCFAGPGRHVWGFLVDGEKIPWKKYHELYEGSTT